MNLISTIDKAILEMEKYIEKYNLPKDCLINEVKVLRLIRQEFLKNNYEINERVLRVFKDVCTFVAIQLEHTPINDPIFEICDDLTKNISKFEGLDSLRMDFGKGDPI